MYLINLYKEIKTWLKVGKIAKQNKKQLEDYNFRVDWIGRIYTVINLPKEVANNNYQVKQGYILMRDRNFDDLFLDLGIAGFIFPEFSPIKNTDSYLLVLTPEREFLNWWAFLKFLFRFGIILLAIRILYLIISKYWDSISDFFSNIFSFIF